MKKGISVKTFVGLVAAAITGVVAFANEVNNQKKEQMISDMDKRIKKLEKLEKNED